MMPPSKRWPLSNKQWWLPPWRPPSPPPNWSPTWWTYKQRALPLPLVLPNITEKLEKRFGHEIHSATARAFSPTRPPSPALPAPRDRNNAHRLQPLRHVSHSSMMSRQHSNNNLAKYIWRGLVMMYSILWKYIMTANVDSNKIGDFFLYIYLYIQSDLF